VGTIIGGLLAFFIVALAAFSERVAADTSPIDQGIARILIVVIAVVVWFAAFSVLGLKLNFNIGGTPAT
jgi:hypothetical protein